MMTSRAKVHGLDPESGTDGQVPVISGGRFVIGDAPGASGPALLPLTTEVNGIPDLVWDDNNNLVYAEAP